MKSPVFFASMRAFSEHESTTAKLSRLFDRAGFAEIVGPGDRTALKLHFGETGNDGFISPVWVRQIVEKVKACGGMPFLTDTNTLYRGDRSNAVDHIRTAILHGFDFSVAGAPVIIADGLDGSNIRRVSIGKNHFQDVSIAGDIAACQSMLVLSHFKGHAASGFGGAIKNLGMGCAAPEGKRDQHNARPFVIPERCTGCEDCRKLCPVSAISMEDRHSRINSELCFGCFACLHACQKNAIDINWETDLPEFMERMAEYAYGAVCGKERKTGFMNFLIRITPDCDCLPFSDAPFVPDIGILASRDPVAIDAASFDLVNGQAGITRFLPGTYHPPVGDKFQDIHAGTDGYRQIRYAEQIGLGSAEYDLIPI